MISSLPTAMKLVQKIYFKLWLLNEQLSGAKQSASSDYHAHSLIPEVVVENRGRGDEADEQLTCKFFFFPFFSATHN